MRALITFTFVFLSVASFLGCKEEANIHLSYLACEYLTDPLGIDVREPQLSWQLKSDQRGQKQIAC